ncbi:hypothetical protein [Streptomyces lavendulocolor]|uniref:hypothetical protein n=1 Tax=Streptomyces lavendulocolor TaxID=67316 RepID=UPI0031D80248
MGRRTPRRRSAKPPSGRFASSERTGRNKTRRYVNRFGNGAIVPFLSLLFAGYILISEPNIQVTVPQGTAYAISAALSGTALTTYRARRYRR